MAYKNPEPKLDDIVEEILEGKGLEEKGNDYKKSEKVYFAFIDVLGFKKTFDDIRISQKESEAEKYRDVFNYFFDLMNAAMFMKWGSNSGCYAGQTSDSLYFYTERIDYLVQFIKIFAHFNLYAMSKDVFFRGGIAKGDLYKKANYQFYGDSVIYAYLLESVVSRNPIVVVDENTNEDLKNDKEYSKLVTEKSGRHYIKPFAYLNQDFTLELDRFDKKEINTKTIVKNIEKNKRLFEYDVKNYDKYNFLLEELKGNKDKEQGIE